MCRKAQRHGRKGRGEGGKSSSNKRDVGANGCSYTKLPLTHRGKAPILLGAGRSLVREARPGMLTELPRQLAGHHRMWKRRRGDATGHPFERNKKSSLSLRSPRCKAPCPARKPSAAPGTARGGRGGAEPFKWAKSLRKKLVGIPRRVAESDLSRQRGHTQTFISI